MKNLVILFQGDSVTDCNRRIHDDYGEGYVHEISKNYPNHTIINRGISGNKTSDLFARWQKDTMDFTPDILCILIGINDVWHRYAFGTGETITDYENYYRKMLEQVKEKLPKTFIIMMEPFMFTVDDFQRSFRKDLDEEIQVTRMLAREFADEYIPLDGFLAEQALKYNEFDLLHDGIHPTVKGHSLIAKEVINRIDKLIIKL
ncbi:MAG: SGNH/GDSL hydrolase family protein [Firmicutes bacterium]|nr:SGNH/GDSL hydrolase family protein [Bacillota bacterium]